MNTTHDKLVILDRDGVINHDSDDYIKSTEEFVLIDNSIEAIIDLKKSGYKIAIATNQSGLSRGYFDLKELQKMHDIINKKLSKYNQKIDIIEFCPHLPEVNCECRKPNPGMIYKILEKLAINDLQNCWMIGDSLKDIYAGQEADLKTLLVSTGKGEEILSTPSLFDKIPKSTNIFKNLDEASKFIIKNTLRE